MCSSNSNNIINGGNDHVIDHHHDIDNNDRATMNRTRKEMIASTKFVYIVAKSGIGKTFAGDYLEVVHRNCKHVDGDHPCKNPSNPEYRDATQQLFGVEQYETLKKNDKEWYHLESWKAYMKCVADLALETATKNTTDDLDNDSSSSNCNKQQNVVVITHVSHFVRQREYFRNLLIDAGAKDVHTVFLHCDKDVHMRAVWTRWERMAQQGGLTIEQTLKLIGAVGVTDFESFVAWSDSSDIFEGPDESLEKPFCDVVDVTAKDATVIDSLEKACLGVVKVEDKTDDGLTYEELVEKIRRVDEERDAKLFEQTEKLKEQAQNATTTTA